MALGDNLISKGLITKEQLEAALEKQKKEPDKRLGAVLIAMGLVTEAQISASL